MKRGAKSYNEEEELRFLPRRPFGAWEPASHEEDNDYNGEGYEPIGDTVEDLELSEKRYQMMTEVLRTGSLMLAALLAFGAMLVYLRFLMVPLVFSRFLVYAFQPLVKYLSGRRPFSCMGSTVRLALPRWASVLIILGLIITTLLILCLVLGYTIHDLISNSEFYLLRIDRLTNSLIAFAETLGYNKDDLKKMLPAIDAGSYALSVLEFITNRFPEMILVLLIVVYMLLDLEDQEEILLHHKRSLAARRAHRIDKHIRTYVIIHSLISLAAAGITTFVLLLFEVDLALFFGLITFVLGYIPNVGPAISVVLPLPMIILDPRPIVVRLIFIFIFLTATQFALTQLVEPKVLGKVMNIPAVTIIVALLFWGSVWGIVGAIISVPLTVSIKMYLENLDHPATQAIAGFLGGDFSVLDLTRDGELAPDTAKVIVDEPIVDLQSTATVH